MFIEAKDDGSGGEKTGDNWSYKSCKAPVKSYITSHGLVYPKLTWGSSSFVFDQ